MLIQYGKTASAGKDIYFNLFAPRWLELELIMTNCEESGFSGIRLIWLIDLSIVIILIDLVIRSAQFFRSSFRDLWEEGLFSYVHTQLSILIHLWQTHSCVGMCLSSLFII